MGIRFGFQKIPTYTARAILFNVHGRGPAFSFSRHLCTGSPTSQRTLEIPSLTEAQAEALDMVYFVGMENCLNIKLKSGDIGIFNNLSVLQLGTLSSIPMLENAIYFARGYAMKEDRGRHHTLYKESGNTYTRATGLGSISTSSIGPSSQGQIQYVLPTLNTPILTPRLLTQ